ncbi:MAG: sulfite exporter TauE/SafE family protein [Planctomycetota bacterium]|nr:sulfite exporter TauE/SafE family protein [Planctomycetota bacterium]
MIWELVTTGLFGSLHCVGMCGGFVLGIDRPDRGRWRRVGVQALFHLGKTATYVTLGGLIGIGGAALLHSGWLASAQAVLSVLAGTLMILAGIQIMGLLKEWPVGSWFGPQSLYGRTFQAAMNLKSPMAPFVTGALTGFLPCPLVYAFLAAGLYTGSLLGSMGVMSILGLTSMPALLLVVWTGSMVRPQTRARIIKVAGAVVLVLGVITVLRGLFPELLHGGHEHHGHH